MIHLCPQLIYHSDCFNASFLAQLRESTEKTQKKLTLLPHQVSPKDLYTTPYSNLFSGFRKTNWQNEIPPLKLEEVKQHSELYNWINLKTEEKVKIRTMDDFFWKEENYLEAADYRIKFINVLIETLFIKNLLITKPITLISLGSSGLLMEKLIHSQLLKVGFEKINWVFIDPLYDEQHDKIGFENIFTAFCKNENLESVKVFSTEQEYLSASQESTNSDAALDMKKGHIVLLNILPPVAVFDHYNAREKMFNDRISVTCAPLKSIKKSNAILFMIQYKNQSDKKFFRMIENKLTNDFNAVIELEEAFFIYKKPDKKIAMYMPTENNCAYIIRLFKKFLEKKYLVYGELKDIEKAWHIFRNEYISDIPVHSFYCSHYELSAANLINQFLQDEKNFTVLTLDNGKEDFDKKGFPNPSVMIDRANYISDKYNIQMRKINK